MFDYVTFFKLRERIRLKKKKTIKFLPNKYIIYFSVFTSNFLVFSLIKNLLFIKNNDIFNQPKQYSDLIFDLN